MGHSRSTTLYHSHARGKTRFRQANNQETSKSYYRTAKHRRLRAELIQRWKPWEQSTGPRTIEGKATSARNRYRGAERDMLRTLAKLLRSGELIATAHPRDAAIR
jgi:hypothetical protein